MPLWSRSGGKAWIVVAVAIYYLGIDFGTSGARAIAIDGHRRPVSRVQRHYGDRPLKDPQTWRTTLTALLARLPLEIRRATHGIAVNGTSSTVLLCDHQGIPLGDALLYNDKRAYPLVETIRQIAPVGSPVISATSTLAKLLWWCCGDWSNVPRQATYLMHQADWISWLLHDQLGISDYHNALKLGYDVGTLTYPNWLTQLAIAPLLPRVVAPGSAIAPVSAAIAQQFNFPTTCQVYAGTTDSIAAFLASGAQHPGDGVTSLGSTLVIKLLSRTRVDNSEFGIYSHRCGELWLVGGASNTGGAVLSHFFSPEDLAQLSEQIPWDRPSDLDYYPLLSPGERFPINDPHLAPRLSPRPDSDQQFLHGLLTGMSRIEALGYARLHELGASPLRQVYTAGGGSQNLGWRALRQQTLAIPVKIAQQPDAAYGTALLTLNSGLKIS